MSEPKAKKPFYKKWWVWAIAVVVVIGIANSGGNGGSTPTGGQATDQTQKEDSVPTSKKGVSSDVKIAVLGLEEKDNVGNEYVKENAQGIFKIIEVSITNNQKDAITIDSNSFKLIDDKGREFTYSVEGQSSFDIATGNESLFLKSLNPGLTLKSKIIFDVPKDATGLYLKTQGGMMGKEIKLKIS